MENKSRLSPELKDKLKQIKLIVLDFDGVLTDNTVVHFENGFEGVVRSQEDSFGVDLLYDAGVYNKPDYTSTNHNVDLLILSRATGGIVKSVAEKIKIKCSNSLYDKFGALGDEVKKRGLDYSEVLFIGNDLNDFQCIKFAGVGVAVADSYPKILEIADYVTLKKGGRGAFREVCELVLNAKFNSKISPGLYCPSSSVPTSGGSEKKIVQLKEDKIFKMGEAKVTAMARK